jgi:glycosyltransferase involved in cell wall biosynthesis
LAGLPHVRILLCTRNGAAWLPAQLESYLAQKHDDWSVWVSDDASSDNTREVIERFAARHPGRIACCVEGPGKGSAANYLSLLCHPELPPGPVALSDQDDLWLPDRLSAALTALEAAGPAPCAWAGAYFVSDAALRPQHLAGIWPHPPTLGNALVQNVLSGHTLTLNAAALARLRAAGVQDVPHHDWWIYLMLMASGGRAIADRRPVLLYRQHDANTVGARHAMLGRIARASGLWRGHLRDWIDANMAALSRCTPLLTPEAAALVDLWRSGARVEMLRTGGAFRQSRVETALLRLAARCGRV